MTRQDVERLLHCARTEGMGAGPNTLAEVCEWALEQERLRRLGDHHHASCSMLAARLVAVEKERDEAREQRNKAQADAQWIVERYAVEAARQRNAAGKEVEVWRKEHEQAHGNWLETRKRCEADEEPVAVRSDIGPGQPTPSITMDTTAPDPAPSVCSVCGVGAGKHKPDCSRPPAPSAEPRMFPIMGGPAIPWGVIAPHDRQAKLNHGGQSLVRLAERGGLSPSEAVAVLEDRKWRAMSDEAALARLKVLAGWLPPDEVERRIAEARDEALEEAALLWEYDPGIGAAAIRALKSKKETP